MPFGSDRIVFPRMKPKRVTVLVVDDDRGVIETFGRALKREGYEVRTAVTAEAGLDEAVVSRPDVILLDLRMPIVDGLAFLRRLRAHAHLRHTPVAIVTGVYFLEDEVKSELAALGAQLHFKPLWLDELVRIVRKLVKGRAAGIVRSARVPAPDIKARLGSEFGRLVNVSASGALVRTGAPFLLGRVCPLILDLPDSPVTLTVRIVRAEPTAPTGQREEESHVQYHVGVMFTEFPSAARQVIEKLCGAAFRRHESQLA